MSVYKRGNIYWFKFTFDGELIQKSTKLKNKKDAELVERAFRTQLALGKIGIKPKKKIETPTFEKAVNDFLAFSEVKNSPKTYARYVFAFQPLLSRFSKKDVATFTSQDIENYVSERSKEISRKTKQPITRETINHELLGFRIIFRRLMLSELITDNPAQKIKKLKPNDRKFHVISKDEEIRYLFACPQPLKDVAGLMLETGLRCGEVYNLKRQDISLENGFLKVAKGKTASSIRQVPLSEKAEKIVAYRLNKFKGENLFPEKDVDGNEPSNDLSQKHLVVIGNLGFNFRLYDCRHTFATRAVQSGVDLLTLAYLLGHSGLKMVMRYAHPSEQMKAEAIKKMQIAKTA